MCVGRFGRVVLIQSPGKYSAARCLLGDLGRWHGYTDLGSQFIPNGLN